MALRFLTRTLRQTHFQFLLPLTLHSTSPPPSSLSPYQLSQAFHQTVTIPSHSLPPSFTHLSVFHPFTTQALTHPIDFDDNDFHFDGDPQFLQLLKGVAHFSSEAEATPFLDGSGIRASRDLVGSAIWELREDSKAAFLVFKWGEKWNCNDEKVYQLMIWVLGNHKRFSTAWCLIRDMHRSSLCTRQAMLIMIDRYASGNDSAKAIQTFNFMEKFRLTPDNEAFHTFLHALCKHGNIEEAEEFMLVNKKLFPLEIESFNIILNGWCNISVDVFEAKRVWREMSNYCITPDATSHSHMISCFSKTGNLFDSLRLYDAMKKRGWKPGIEVYNSLVYVLTRENCLKEALKIIDKLKEEGLQPDSSTFNSMIRPLCEARKLAQARILLNTMVEENLSPTIETYHAFLEGTDYQGSLEFLSRMRSDGLGPKGDSFLIILEKFFKLEQPASALRIWQEMNTFEVVPSCLHYSRMVEGLANCGWLIKAREFHEEMISNGCLEEPKLKKILQEEVLESGDKDKQNGKRVNSGKRFSHHKRKMKQKRS
ncbi:pentatricopeptide repeat-containing protein [Senna tora]|uniref:Pentatricopeptide repeat-containing protein n=1 Tax=Senna tora TaxID=362788 RepID=A0A834WAR0_9FABA|nr:pentatricopeptide repeat-containing protein [Senna tora]